MVSATTCWPRCAAKRVLPFVLMPCGVVASLGKYCDDISTSGNYVSHRFGKCSQSCFLVLEWQLHSCSRVGVCLAALHVERLRKHTAWRHVSFPLLEQRLTTFACVIASVKPRMRIRTSVYGWPVWMNPVHPCIVFTHPHRHL
jgi:hypothetical protein